MTEKYDQIGKNYNSTRKADAYLTGRLYYHLNPQRGEVFLDIGCGTGNYTIELNQRGIEFIGVDPSTEMLKKAKDKTNKIGWKLGSSEAIPLENESVAGALASLTIHHWSDLEKAFVELNRVLKLSGKIVIFTSTPKQMKGYWLNHYFPKMLSDSSKQMPSFEVLKTAMNNAVFEIVEKEKYFVREDLEDLFLYSGKHNPKLYLNAKVRKGISSFSDLANANEVKKGLDKLKNDIEDGIIQEIIKSYQNDNGDYLFIVAKKQRSKK